MFDCRYFVAVVTCCLIPLSLVLCDEFPNIYNSERETNVQIMPAEEAARTAEVPEGFRVSLFASEPDVQNPIAMAWDERGRMWVAENYTYAERPMRFDRTLRDRVLILQDTDNDGRADSRKVFTDQVQMLTSVEVGRGGVWLMTPPNLLFIPDTNGDDVPDGPAQVILDGFAVAQDNYHNFANGLRWGPDGWLYGRCGHSCPGNIGRPGTPEEERVPIDGGIWRFHPEMKFFEVLCQGTVNPWGHDWDEHGELFFINTVIGHLWHMIPGSHFKESFGESSHPFVYERLDTIADHYHFNTAISRTEGRYGRANEYGGGHAHIGMMIYQNGHWPAEYHNKLFTLNMHGQRGNVERLERIGTGYVGRHEPDFFISADPYFRGLEISVGPDRNVYLLDWSDTGECHEATGVHRTSGRIFKVSHGESAVLDPLPKPLCLGGTGELPQLWKAYQQGEMSSKQLRGLLSDPDEHVRVWAIRLLTDFWPMDLIDGRSALRDYPAEPGTVAELVQLARKEESGLVLLTLASTLQRMPITARTRLAKELVQRKELAHDRTYPYMLWYGMMPIGRDAPESLVQLANDCEIPLTLRWITRCIASQSDGNAQPLNSLLGQATLMSTELREEVLLGMNEAFRGWRAASLPENWDAFRSGLDSTKHSEIVRELNILFGDGRSLEMVKRVALDSNAALQDRVSALNTLIKSRPDDLRHICERLMDVRVLNATAARGLALFDTPETAALLARSYRRFQPVDRPQLIELLVLRPSFAIALLDQLGPERGQIPPAEVSPFHARQILSLNHPEATRKLQENWGELRDTPEERQQLISELRSQLTTNHLRKADLSAGRALFRKSCAKCHQLYEDGVKIGPNLTGSQRNNLDYLLENMLDPSAVVGKDYRMSVVAMNDGRVLNGLIVTQNDKTLILQTQTEQQTLAQEDIDEIKTTNLSPMPDGLLKDLTKEQIRDLFGYLMHPNQVSLPAN